MQETAARKQQRPSAVARLSAQSAASSVAPGSPGQDERSAEPDADRIDSEPTGAAAAGPQEQPASPGQRRKPGPKPEASAAKAAGPAPEAARADAGQPASPRQPKKPGPKPKAEQSGQPASSEAAAGQPAGPKPRRKPGPKPQPKLQVHFLHTPGSKRSNLLCDAETMHAGSCTQQQGIAACSLLSRMLGECAVGCTPGQRLSETCQPTGRQLQCIWHVQAAAAQAAAAPREQATEQPTDLALMVRESARAVLGGTSATSQRPYAKAQPDAMAELLASAGAQQVPVLVIRTAAHLQPSAAERTDVAAPISCSGPGS